MIRTYNIISETDGDKRIISTFEVEGERTELTHTPEMIETELIDLAIHKFTDFKDNLSLEEEE